LILATIFTLNVELISFYFINVNKYYYAGLAILFAILFILLFRNIQYDYVKNYKISKKVKIIIWISLLLDFTGIFIFANILRNGKFIM